MIRKLTLGAAACLSLAAAQRTSAQTVTITELTTTSSSCNRNGGVVFTATAFTVSGFNFDPCPGATLRVEGPNGYTSGNVSLQGNLTYLYNFNGPLNAGDYTAFVDGCGITATQAFTISNCVGGFVPYCVDPVGWSNWTEDTDWCNNSQGSFTIQATGGVNTLLNPAGPITLYLNGGSPQTVTQGGYATWSNLPAGGYTITASTSDCPIAQGADGFINVFAGPPNMAASTTQVNPTNGANGAINLSVTGGTPPYTFAWSNASTIEDPINLFPGTYSVTATDVHDCTATASATLIDAVGIEENELNNAVSLYPNPTNGHLNLEIAGALPSANTMIALSDVLGRMISTQRAISGLQQIDLSGQPKGIYVLQVRDGAKVTTRRITLQ